MYLILYILKHHKKHDNINNLQNNHNYQVSETIRLLTLHTHPQQVDPVFHLRGFYHSRVSCRIHLYDLAKENQTNMLIKIITK